MNSKLIAGIIALIVIVSGAYLMFFNQPEQEMIFSDGVKQINFLWEKNKVNSASFLLNDSTEISFNESDLDALDSDLREFQSSLSEMKQTKDLEALSDFTEIHLLLVQELKLALKTKKISGELKLKEINAGNLCSNKSELKLIGENTIELNKKMLELNELIFAFSEIHSGLEETANLNSFIADSGDFSEIKSENELLLAELERVC